MTATLVFLERSDRSLYVKKRLSDGAIDCRGAPHFALCVHLAESMTHTSSTLSRFSS
jgi:hypothetical protein